MMPPPVMAAEKERADKTQSANQQRLIRMRETRTTANPDVDFDVSQL